MAFITPMGIVSLFSDMTHEGARSILGEYLNLTGASAATIGFVSGIGELCGYSLRLLSGFADFTLITLHAAKTQAFPTSTLSLLYAAAMAVDAFAALFFGWLFDKIGLKALMASTLCSTFFACFVFLTGNPVMMGIGIVLWGIGMGAQESIMKAAVSEIIPRSMRSTGFGIFETGFGIAWFLGSWLLGALYDISPRMAGSRFGGGTAVGYRLLCPVHPPAGEGALTAERRKALFAAAPAPHTKKHFPTSRFRRC